MALRSAASFGAGAAGITAASSMSDPLSSLGAQLGFGGVERGADELAKAMQRQMEGLEARLEKVLSSGPPPAAAPIIIRDGGGRRGPEWSLGALGGALAVWVVFCKATGRRPLSPLAALLPVSRAALAQSCAAIDAGVRACSDAVGRVREQLHDLAGRVDAGLHEQRAMREQLDGVSREVGDMRASVDEMHEGVKQCDAKMIEASEQQEFANRGIQLLCSVVHDVIQPAGAGVNMISSRERLRAFSQGGTQPALAEERATGTAQLGLLLGGGARATPGNGSFSPAPSDLAAGAPHASATGYTSQLRMLARIGSCAGFGSGGDAGGGSASVRPRGDSDEPGPHMPEAPSGSSLSSATSATSDD